MLVNLPEHTNRCVFLLRKIIIIDSGSQIYFQRFTLQTVRNIRKFARKGPFHMIIFSNCICVAKQFPDKTD